MRCRWGRISGPSWRAWGFPTKTTAVEQSGWFAATTQWFVYDECTGERTWLGWPTGGRIAFFCERDWLRERLER